MNKKTQIAVETILVLPAAAASVCGGVVGVEVILEIQKVLIGFAGLVVTIFGIWIAVIFPVLSGLLAEGRVREEVTQLARYDVLVRALYRSCFSLTTSFFVFLLLSLSSQHSENLLRSASFFSWMVFFATSWALWSAIWSGEGAVVLGVNESVKKGVLNRFRSLGKTARRGKT